MLHCTHYCRLCKIIAPCTQAYLASAHACVRLRVPAGICTRPGSRRTAPVCLSVLERSDLAAARAAQGQGDRPRSSTDRTGPFRSPRERSGTPGLAGQQLTRCSRFLLFPRTRGSSRHTRPAAQTCHCHTREASHTLLPRTRTTRPRATAQPRSGGETG